MLKGEQAKHDELRNKYRDSLEMLQESPIIDERMMGHKLYVAATVSDPALPGRMLEAARRINDQYQDELILNIGVFPGGAGAEQQQYRDLTSPKRGGPLTPPTAPPPAGQITYQVQRGDTLKKVAQLFYGTENPEERAQQIAQANGVGANPEEELHTGTALVIPFPK